MEKKWGGEGKERRKGGEGIAGNGEKEGKGKEVVESEEVRRMREEVERLEVQVRDKKSIVEGQKLINIGVAKELEKFIFADSKLRRELCDLIHHNESLLEEVADKRRAFEQNTRKHELKKRELETLRSWLLTQKTQTERQGRSV